MRRMTATLRCNGRDNDEGCGCSAHSLLDAFYPNVAVERFNSSKMRLKPNY
jgi:hypothetical protein